MNNKKTVLIIDDDPKNKEILVGGLINSQFQVITADSGMDGLEKARQLIPDLILVDMEVSDLGGLEFLERIKSEKYIADLPVVLLTTREDGPDRLRAYEYGAKDYIIKPLHVSEIVAKVRIILSRLDRRREEQSPEIEDLSGNLADKGLLELMEAFAAQGLTGILTLTNDPGRQGQVFFADGHVVNATIDDFRAERAIFQMVGWSAGRYMMVIQDIHVEREITMGNLDLVLQSKKRLEKRRKILMELPSLDVHFTLSDSFLKIIENREMSSEITEFIDMFDGSRGLQELLALNRHDELMTLERIVKMYDQGFLTPVEKTEEPAATEPEPGAAGPAYASGEPVSGELTSDEPVSGERVSEEPASDDFTADEAGSGEGAAEERTADEPGFEGSAVTEPAAEEHESADAAGPQPESEDESPAQEPAPARAPQREPVFNEKEYELLQKRLTGVLGDERRTMVVVGTANSGKSDFIRALTEGSYTTRNLKNIFPHPIDIGKVQATADLELTLIGIPVEKRLGIFLDSIESSMLGYVMLVNAIEPESFDYLGYLIKCFRQQYQIPYAIAITNLRHPQAPGIELLTQELGLEDFEEVVPCNPADAQNVKMVFLSMYAPYSSRESMKLSADLSEYN